MNSDWLESFLVFSESMNFTHAAEKLHISQPALHIKIRKLSEFLDTALYIKSGRALKLTQEGIKVQRFARELRDRTSAMIDELRLGHDSQTVNLTAGTGAYLYLLGDALADFENEHDFPLRLMVSNKEETLRAVETGEAHIGVAALSTAHSGLSLTKLTQVEQSLVVTKKHRLSKRKKVRIGDLKDEKLILPPSGYPHRTTVEQALVANNTPWELGIEAVGWELMIRFVQLGIGSTIVNACCNIPDDLIAIPVSDLPNINYYIVERETGWVSRGVSQLKESLITHASRWRR